MRPRRRYCRRRRFDRVARAGLWERHGGEAEQRALILQRAGLVAHRQRLEV